MKKREFDLKKNCKIFNNDILYYNLNNHTNRDTIVFLNLPYNISTQILAKFISVKLWPPFYSKIIFMFQKEVAERILAKKNTRQYGRITVLVNFKLDIINHFNISKTCFFPKPKVDSTIIVFKPKNSFQYEIKDIKNLEKVTHIFFSNIRKMINKAFSKLFKNYSKIYSELKINPNMRPSELSCNDFYKITKIYERLFK